MKRLRKKLRSQAGESIAETLVALLIAALALTMLAAMINSTVNMVKTSEIKMDDYYKINLKLEEIGTDSQGKITLTDGSKISIEKDVYQARNETFQKTPVVAYRSKPGT